MCARTSRGWKTTLVWANVRSPSRAAPNTMDKAQKCVGTKLLASVGCISLVVVSSACTRQGNRPVPQEGRGDFVTQTVQADTYNYTEHEIVDISFDDDRRPFDVRLAAPGASVYFYSAATLDIGSGLKATVSRSACCFMWNYKSAEEITLKVVWLVVYARDVYEAAGRDTDERKMLSALPGSEWCEARVKVPQPYPSDRRRLALHFLPDGSVTARLFDNFLQEHQVLSGETVSKFMKSGQPACQRRTSNPWYGIPRTPHRE